MNQTNVLMRIVEMARVGGALSPEEAMSTVSAMISRLDVHRASYESGIDALVRIGATIWSLASRPGESPDPE